MESVLCTFSCIGCGRDGFMVVDRNPPIPMDVVEVYDKDNEGESCQECPKCEQPFPSFGLYRKPKPRSDNRGEGVGGSPKGGGGSPLRVERYTRERIDPELVMDVRRGMYGGRDK